MERHTVLEQLLNELERFLKVLDRENLSSEATVQKSLLSDLLKSYLSANGANSGCDEEYIYMNKVMVSGPIQDKKPCGKAESLDALTNGLLGKYISPPQKSLPELPLPRLCSLPLPEPPEGYYEEAQPYDTATNDDCEAVSSSYESYDEEETTKGKSAAQHQWPSTEASIELMKDSRICAFLWRKKWLGQWAKQLCVVREQRLLCYKSSKDQTPQLDVSLVGCTVVYKEKQVKKKEHRLKVVPVGAEAIVLGLQSKEQAEQWLKVIQEVSGKPLEPSEASQSSSESPRLACPKGELSERHSVASESGSSTDSHAETTDAKDGKKRYGAALMLSNLLNIGKKNPSSLESPEKLVDTSGYLNVLVNSQWRARWCLIKNGQLWFYQDKAKTKVAQQPLSLEGCMILPDPSPEHLYSFRIEQDGEQRATLEAKSSADMGHWLGLLLSQTGSKTSPEELTYDYVDTERISCIVSAAKNSMYLMQRRFSEPNAYTDNLHTAPDDSDDIYDNVANTDPEQEETQQSSGETVTGDQDSPDRIYLDLIPVRSFLHNNNACRKSHQRSREPSPMGRGTEKEETMNQSVSPPPPEPRPPHTLLPPSQEPSAPPTSPRPEPEPLTIAVQVQSQLPPSEENPKKPFRRSRSPQPSKPLRSCKGGSEGAERPRSTAPAEVKLGKNRTEADVLKFTEERDRLEKEKEQVRNTLSTLRGQRKELKEALATAQDPAQHSSLEAQLKEMEELCRAEERRRVDLELQLVEVKESLKKVEAGPFTLGTAVDSGLLDTNILTSTLKVTTPSSAAPAASPSNGDSSPVNSASSLKNRPLSTVVSSKGKVLQKAKEWEKKSMT
ncbi:actin filament-associated protein 1-like 2 [Scleropages formosus]|uniref:Actin filament-associated protein 1-like 2 n=1 Tax=Scleropages formosus TaxID=113540 RepID=A0A8C9SCJ4_SCLFO|nr:actin filament-associated protein 1-like 2 [Scleropages formosus]